MRGHSARFVRVTAANFFFFLNFASFFLLPLRVRELGGTEGTIGLAMGATGLAGLASLFAVGWALDRLGRRVVLLGGFATMAAASAAFVFVDRLGPALYVLRVVQGVAFAASFNASSTLAVEFAPPDRRAAALGLFGVSTLTTHALAPALGEQLVHVAGFGILFVVAAAFSVVAMAVAWSLPGGRVVVPHDAPQAAPGPELYATLATVACCGVAFGTVITYVPTFVREAHLGAVGTFFLSYTAAAVLTRITAGGAGDTYGRRPVIVPALAVLVAATAGLGAVHSPVALAAVALCFGTAQGILYPTLNAFAIDQVEAAQVGRTQTAYNGAFNLGTTLGSFALGPVVQAIGYRPTFCCAGGMALVALAVFAFGTGRTAAVAPDGAVTRRSAGGASR